MNKEDRISILQAAAKTLAWELFAAAEYGHTRAWISIEDFDRELRSSARRWRATHKNLNTRKEQ